MCQCKGKPGYSGCGCSSNFDNASGDKLKSLVNKGKDLIQKGKDFSAGLQSGGANQSNNTPPPPITAKDNTMMYWGIGIGVVILIIIVVVVIKNRKGK